MTVRKLSNSDKNDILNLYRQTGETTSTLAERYDVSNSTISRLLKSTLPEDEYEALIAAKRAARTYYPNAEQTVLFSEPESDVAVRATETRPLAEVSLSSPEIVFDENLESEPEAIFPSREPLHIDVTAQNINSLPNVTDSGAQASAVAQITGEDLLDAADDLTNFDDEDIDDEDEDIDDDIDDEDIDEDEDINESTPIVRRRLPVEGLVQVLPLSEANLPKTCYLVIDRASELITRPLKDFSDLGQIPTQEIQQKTLPVFDNHRVARRFSTKRDRVIKIPDSRLLQKACSQLQAKGITRLLVDGQVYSLSPTLY
ncbi:MAG: helix-turn-helix domain-containing protein [Chroococcidiopsidaceae cyanobacterium CP_BM_ER_R8_30]|nr:helix-turn-helix domain-containing protein [Chroococcidiopsidaceae cyanobacterium CP_BM_ER_R8_30]